MHTSTADPSQSLLTTNLLPPFLAQRKASLPLLLPDSRGGPGYFQRINTKSSFVPQESMEMQMVSLVSLLSDVSPKDTSSDPRVFNISQMESLPVTVRQLRAGMHSDWILSKVYRYVKGNWPHHVPKCLQPFANRRNELTVEEGCLLWGFRVIIPLRLREKLLDELHRDHPGVTRMKSVARSYMWWPGMDSEIEHIAKSCQSCQSVKGNLPVVPLHPWLWPSRSWQRLHLDFAGPFKD